MNNLLKGDRVIANNPKSKKLTHGKIYFVKWISCGGYIAVKNDDRRTKPYHEDNFIWEDKQD